MEEKLIFSTFSYENTVARFKTCGLFGMILQGLLIRVYLEKNSEFQLETFEKAGKVEIIC